MAESLYPLNKLLFTEVLPAIPVLLFLPVLYFLFFLIFQIIRATVSPEKRLTVLVSVRLQRKWKEVMWFQDSHYVRKVDVYPA